MKLYLEIHKINLENYEAIVKITKVDISIFFIQLLKTGEGLRCISDCPIFKYIVR